MLSDLKRFKQLVKKVENRRSPRIKHQTVFTTIVRFIGRYDFAKSFSDITITPKTNLKNRTVQNYQELNKLFLCITTLEMLFKCYLIIPDCRIFGEKKQRYDRRK